MPGDAGWIIRWLIEDAAMADLSFATAWTGFGHPWAGNTPDVRPQGDILCARERSLAIDTFHLAVGVSR